MGRAVFIGKYRGIAPACSPHRFRSQSLVFLPLRRVSLHRRRSAHRRHSTIASTPRFTFDSWSLIPLPGYHERHGNHALDLVARFVAIASAVLAWFIMQSRMEVALAQQREQLAESRGALSAEKTAVRDSVEIAVHAAEERAHRQALEGSWEK